MIYELWRSGDGSYDFFPSTNNSARALLDDDAELIKKIEAETWESARQKQYELLGWGNYQPEPDSGDHDLSPPRVKKRKSAQSARFRIGGFKIHQIHAKQVDSR